MSRIAMRPKLRPRHQLSQSLVVAAAITSVLMISIMLGTLGLTRVLEIVGALAALGLGAVLIISRQDALLAVVCISASVLIDWLQEVPWPYDIVPVAALVALAVIGYRWLTQSPEYPWVSPPHLWLWGLLPVLAAPAIYTSILLSEALYYYMWFMIVPLVMYLLGILVARDLSQVRRLLSLLSGFGALIALHTIIETQTGIFLFQTGSTGSYLAIYSDFIKLPGTQIERAGSFLLNPDSNGTFLAVIALLPVGLFVESRSLLAKTIYGIEFALILVALLDTYSAGGVVAAGVGLVVFLVLPVGSNRHRLGAAALLCIAAAVLYFVFPSQLGLLLQHGSSPQELSLRTGIWQTTIRMIKAYPLTGIGLGPQTFLAREDLYRVPLQYVSEPTAHNSYLELAAGAGLPVLAIFLAILGGALWLAFHNFKQTDRQHRPLLGGLIAAIIVLSINSLQGIGWTLAPAAWMAWLLLGAAGSPLLVRARGSAGRVPGGDVPTAPAEPIIMPRALAQGNSSIQAPRRSFQKIQLEPVDLAGGDNPLRQQSLEQRRTMPLASTPVASQARSEPGMQTSVESHLALLRQLAKNSGVYALASVAQPLVSVVLAPFLAHHLSPADYGILTLLNTAIALMALITQLGISAGFLRAYTLEYSSQRDRYDVVATSLALLLLVSIPTLIGVVFMAPSLASALLHSPSLGWPVVLAAGVLLLQNLTVPGFSWLRAESRTFFFAVLAIGSLVMTLCANLILVGVLHLGIAGSLIATGSGYACVAVCTVPVILVRAGIKVRRDVAISILTFGVPHVPGFISFWILQLSDRYLLSLFGSLSQVASYSVSYTMGSALTIVLITPFGFAWATSMYAIAKRSDAANVFRLVFRWYSILLLFAAFGLSLVGSTALGLLFPAAYQAAAPIIPVIAASAVLYGIQGVFMIGANVRRKSWFVAAFVTAAAIINVALNLVLIPRFGAMGAAVATLIAYAALAFLAYVGNQCIYPVPFEIGRFLIALTIGTALYLGAYALSLVLGARWSWPISILALAIYGVGLIGLGGGRSLRRYFRIASSFRRYFRIASS